MYRVQRAYHTLHAGMPVRVANAQETSYAHYIPECCFPKASSSTVCESIRPPVLCILVTTDMPILYYVHAC